MLTQSSNRVTGSGSGSGSDLVGTNSEDEWIFFSSLWRPLFLKIAAVFSLCDGAALYCLLFSTVRRERSPGHLTDTHTHTY